VTLSQPGSEPFDKTGARIGAAPAVPPIRSLIALALFGTCYALLALWLDGVAGLMVGMVLLAGVVLFWSECAEWIVFRELGGHGRVLSPSPDIAHLLAALSAKAGMPSPGLHVVAGHALNACTIGLTPTRSAILVTSALLTTLKKEELAGVFSHELAHVRSRDTLTMTVISAITVTAMGLGACLTLFGRSLGRRGWPLRMLGSLATFSFGLAALAVSRDQEYRADELGAAICGHPEWLIAALQKLEHLAPSRSVTSSLLQPAIAPLLFADIGFGRASDQLWSTHPPSARRIARLASMCEIRRRTS
jgi:heat shock protein HtpX